MKTLILVNNNHPACGVFQYGKRVGDIFKRSKQYNVVYCEPSSEPELMELIKFWKDQGSVIIIYNYLSITMSWLTDSGVSAIRRIGIKQGLIVHNTGYSQMFDFYFHQVPNWPTDENNFTLLRPIFNFNNPALLQNKIPRIGTFGFAFRTKEYPKICELVNAQFEEAEIHMHLTVSHYIPNSGLLSEISSECRNAITKSGIKLNITSDFRDDEAILDFLASNDLNVSLYHSFPHYNGLSSTIDYMLSVQKPIAVCKSGLFAHINEAVPSICVEDSSLPEILRNGFDPVRKFFDAWSHDNFISHMEHALDLASRKYKSQFGEDRFIAENLSHIPIRTFCEVGAHDGVNSSKTYYFEQEGARGICIEADNQLAHMCMTNRVSPTYACAIGKQTGTELFYVDYSIPPERRGNSSLVPHSGTPENVRVHTLYEVLKLAGLMQLDLLSIDTEGTDMDVIAGMGPIRPEIIIAEFWTQPNPPVPDTIKSGIEPLGYKEAHRTEANLIFIKI